MQLTHIATSTLELPEINDPSMRHDMFLALLNAVAVHADPTTAGRILEQFSRSLTGFQS